jgi:hypothetical protein
MRNNYWNLKNVTSRSSTLFQVILDNYDNLSPDPADEAAIDRAMEWEEALMEFLEEWMADPEKYKNFDIAYYTERSVTDEVARGSEGDIVTIAISYLIMLVYVSIALGRFTKLSRFLVSNIEKLASRLPDVWGRTFRFVFKSTFSNGKSVRIRKNIVNIFVFILFCLILNNFRLKKPISSRILNV